MGAPRIREWSALVRNGLCSVARPPGVLVLVLTLGALALRLIGIDFGLPHRIARPDEPYVISSALHVLRDLEPQSFAYPSGYVNLLAIVLAGYYASGRILGRYQGSEDFVAEWHIDPSAFYLLDRGLSALLGALTVPLVYVLGVRVLGRKEGLVAALLMAVAYLHVRDSHFGTADAAVVFACTLALILIHSAHSCPGMKRYFLAALAVGVAVSTKYNAVALVIPLGLSCLMGSFNGVAESPFKQVSRRALGCGSGVVLGFLIATPYLLWNAGQFLEDVGTLGSEKLGGGSHAGIEAGRGWSQHLAVSLWYGIGWPMLLASGAGAVLVWRLGLRAILPMGAFAVTYYALLAPSPVVMVRYALPLVPVLCLLASVCVMGAVSKVRGRWRPVLGGGLVAALVLIPLYRSVRFDQLLLREDSRLTLARWIRENVPGGTTIGFVGDWAAHPALLSTADQIEEGRRYFVGIHGGEGTGMRRLAEHARTTSEPSYFRLITRRGFQGWTDRYKPELEVKSNPRYIVVPDYPAYEQRYLRLGGGAWLDRLLEQEYRRVSTTRTWEEGEMVFDSQDLFFLPYAGLHVVERPGPGYRVFVLRD